MTKQEIISKHKSVERRQSDRMFGGYDFTYMNLTSAGLAMDEYSREVAIDFDEWKFKNKWHQNHSNGYWYQGLIYENQLTSGQLFDIYKQENIEP